MKKTFVTGATGFIGASIVRELLKDGREVRPWFVKVPIQPI